MFLARLATLEQSVWSWGRVRGHLISVVQIYQMGEDVSFCGRQQGRGNIVVEMACNFADGGGALPKFLQNRGLTAATMAVQIA